MGDRLSRYRFYGFGFRGENRGEDSNILVFGNSHADRQGSGNSFRNRHCHWASARLQSIWSSGFGMSAHERAQEFHPGKTHFWDIFAVCPAETQKSDQSESKSGLRELTKIDGSDSCAVRKVKSGKWALAQAIDVWQRATLCTKSLCVSFMCLGTLSTGRFIVILVTQLSKFASRSGRNKGRVSQMIGHSQAAPRFRSAPPVTSSLNSILFTPIKSVSQSLVHTCRIELLIADERRLLVLPGFAALRFAVLSLASSIQRPRTPTLW